MMMKWNAPNHHINVTSSSLQELVRGTLKNLSRLCAFQDIYRTNQLRGRVRQSGLKLPSKLPKVLSSKHPVVVLMLAQPHRNTCHVGTEYARRSLLQQSFRISDLRNGLRSINYSCVQCWKSGMQPLKPD